MNSPNTIVPRACPFCGSAHAFISQPYGPAIPKREFALNYRQACVVCRPLSCVHFELLTENSADGQNGAFDAERTCVTSRPHPNIGAKADNG
jgi:hypothetical protein